MNNFFLYFKMAADGIRKNKTLYFPYIFSCSFTLALLYILLSVEYMIRTGEVRGASKMSSILCMCALLYRIVAVINCHILSPPFQTRCLISGVLCTQCSNPHLWLLVSVCTLIQEKAHPAVCTAGSWEVSRVRVPEESWVIHHPRAGAQASSIPLTSQARHQ